MLINNYNIDVSKFQQNNEGYWVRKWGKNVTLFNKTHKSCNECGEIKSFIEFDKNNKGVFYLIGKCKECASKIYYQPNKEKYDIHYQTNKQEILNNSKIRYHENDERNKSSYQENKEKIINYKHSNATYNEKRLPLGYDYKNVDGYLQIRCYKCNGWMFVTNSKLNGTFQSQKGNMKGQSNLYCSNECKENCSEYHNRSSNKELKAFNLGVSLFEYDLLMNNSKDISVINLAIKKAKERDNYTCRNCGDKNNLHGHHIVPVALCLGTEDEYKIYETSNIKTVCESCHYKIEHVGELSLEKLKNKSKTSICL